MIFCIHKSVLGTPRHLVHDSDKMTYQWVSEVPDNLWTLGDFSSILCIDDLALGVGKTIRTLPAGKWLRQFQEILGDDPTAWTQDIPWSQVMTKAAFQEYAQNVIKDTLRVFENPHTVSYGEVLKSSRKALLSLSRAKINVPLWNINKKSADNGQVDTVVSFRPNSKGYAQLATYDRSESTGRTKTRSGPKILHLKKDFRNMIESRWPRGRIVQMDFVSMEPRILMTLAGKTPKDDVYEYTSQEVLRGKLTRKETKIVVMGVLYGVGTTKLQSLLGNKVNAAEVMSEVRSHFGVRHLENRLKKEHEQNGYITSHYGRVLKPARADVSGLVSYYIQSTGVDLALTCFNQGIEYIHENKLDIEPIFVIHDAILLDVHPDISDYNLSNVANAASHPYKFDNVFPLEVKSA